MYEDDVIKSSYEEGMKKSELKSIEGNKSG